MNQSRYSLKDAKKEAILSLIGMLVDVEPQEMASAVSYYPPIPDVLENYWWFRVKNNKKNGFWLDGVSTYVSVNKETKEVSHYDYLFFYNSLTH